MKDINSQVSEQRNNALRKICRSHDICSLHEKFKTVLHLHQSQSEGNNCGSEIVERYVKRLLFVQIIFWKAQLQWKNKFLIITSKHSAK